MRIGILSDTHDHLGNIRKAVEVFSRNGVEGVIHGGDFCSPFTLAEYKPLADKGIKMYAVFGNNDGDKVYLTKRGGDFCSFVDGARVLTLGDRKIVVIHYPDIADELYKGAAFDLVIYGHNHTPRVEGTAKKLLNPGTCSGYLAEAATVALFDTASMEVEIQRLAP